MDRVLSPRSATIALVVALVAITLAYVGTTQWVDDEVRPSASRSDAGVRRPERGDPPVPPTTSTGPTTSRGVAPTTSAAPVVGPEQVLVAYYDAINRHDYVSAWNLGGRNLGDASYAEFADGYGDTSHVDLLVDATAGPRVEVHLVSTSTGGARRTYVGHYVVSGSQIRSGRLRPSS